MAKELQIVNVQMSRSAVADAYRQVLFPGPVALQWAQYTHRITISAGAAQAWGAYFELLRVDTYVPLGSAANVNGVVLMASVIQAYTHTDFAASALNDSGYVDFKGLRSDARNGLWVAQYVTSNNTTHQLSLTIGFKLL